MAPITASRTRINRGLAAVLAAMFLFLAALGMSDVVESPDLIAVALVIMGFGIGLPLFAYARGREKVKDAFPRSLVVVTYAYAALATVAVFVYAIVSAIQYGHPMMGLYFGVFSYIWAALAYGLVVVPIWGISYLAAKVVRSVAKNAGV